MMSQESSDFPCAAPGRTSKPSLRQTWRLCFCLPSQFLHSTQPLRDLSVGQDCPVSKKQDPPNNLLQNHFAKMEGTIDNLRQNSGDPNPNVVLYPNRIPLNQMV